MRTKRDYYEVLGINKNADEASVKKAYRRLAKKYHPDTNSGNAQAEERFKEITEAYNVLSDKEKRKLYDQFGHAAFEEGFSGAGTYGGDPGGYGSFRSGDGFHEYHFEGNAGGMDDILKEFFGSSFGDSAFGGFSGYGGAGGHGSGTRHSGGPYGRAGSSYAGRGQDVSAQLTLTFEEAAFGGKKLVRLRRDDGSVQSYEVNIPAGIADGKTIRLQGKGAPGMGGGPAGDLLLQITVMEKPGFTRKGQDIYTTVQVPFTTAVFGGEVPVQTIDGTVLCSLKPGTQCGTKIRLRGKGIVSMSQPSVRGDQYVTVEIQVPRDLTMEAKRRLKEFEQSCARRGNRPNGSAA
ncbi:J domain-containing protein [Parablautia sp. Marseille-Q6255]|uniref:J domain-containing protein n=1 Tax=Parablautia sp. Marseille-Q6255 TaxID=3039593 RepID=UPI0024BCF391|nr:J domain-containing protein [Parablautia sp. Marseille-Q6255]